MCASQPWSFSARKVSIKRKVIVGFACSGGCSRSSCTQETSGKAAMSQDQAWDREKPHL